MMRIVFMGTSRFALPILRGILEAGHEVVAVVTQPDKPAGRGRGVHQSPVKLLAAGEGLAVLQPHRVRAPEFVETLRGLNPDVVVVAAYGQILPREILGAPRLGCINVHASLLPRHRGAAPINRAIIAGENVTGVTTFIMDEGMDTGNLLLQKEVKIDDGMDAPALHDLLAAEGASILVETLRRLEEGTIEPVPQDHSAATKAPMLRKEEGEIDWRRGAEEIERLIRGLAPWPGTYTFRHGKMIKIWRGRASPSTVEALPGTVIEAAEERILIKCGIGSLSVEEVQPENRRRMTCGEFLRGHKLSVGERLGRRGRDEEDGQGGGPEGASPRGSG